MRPEAADVSQGKNSAIHLRPGAIGSFQRLTQARIVACDMWLKDQSRNLAPVKTYEIRFPLSSSLKVDELVVKGSKLPDILPSAVEPEEPYLISNA